MTEYAPEHVYEVLGFSKNQEAESLEVAHWRLLQQSDRLDMRRERLLVQRDRAGQPLVHEGFVVGWIPALNLEPGVVDKLLAALDEGLAAGCETLGQLQAWKRGDSS